MRLEGLTNEIDDTPSGIADRASVRPRWGKASSETRELVDSLVDYQDAAREGEWTPTQTSGLIEIRMKRREGGKQKH